MLGDVVVSVKQPNGKPGGEDPRAIILYLVLHGILHLTGSITKKGAAGPRAHISRAEASPVLRVAGLPPEDVTL